jgi:redox-sensitive bicupin YhaK (pirin superfamily)
VWPAWFGIIYIILDLLGLKDLAAKAEDAFGGRVCPMSPDESAADPFILVVHHRHSWFRFDPFRPLFRRLIVPEGFPAHPHRGFETLTYVLPGMKGLVHRDSMGLKMVYGDGDCQWMTAGSGVLHEEMWHNDLTDDSDKNVFQNSELYQIWLNLPARHKMTSPRIQLVRPAQQSESSPAPPEVPVIDLPTANPVDGVTVRLIAGQFGDMIAEVDTFSEVCIIHATIDAGKTLEIPLPPDYTAMVYVRKGKSLVSAEEPLHRHQLTFFERSRLDYPATDGIRLTNSAQDSSDVSDILLLSGRPLREPVAARGAFVMNTQKQLAKAYLDFSQGPLANYWKHELTDEEWKEQIERGKDKFESLNP